MKTKPKIRDCVNPRRLAALLRDLKSLPVYAIVTVLLLSGCSESSEIAKLRREAEQGNDVAQFKLGKAYDNGDGVPADKTKAALWYRAASDQGHLMAQLSLAAAYYQGKGVPRNMMLACMWLNIARASGSDPLTIALTDAYGARMVDDISRQDIVEAQRLSHIWRPMKITSQ